MVERDDWTDPATAADAAAQPLSDATGVPAQDMLDIVNNVDVFEVPVAKGLNYDQATAVRDTRPRRACGCWTAPRACIPKGNLAAQLLGFVGQDDTGLTGLEVRPQPRARRIRGLAHLRARRRSARSSRIGDRTETPPQPGANVVLTIDRYIQRLAEQELDKAINAHDASGGSIIVVRPQDRRDPGDRQPPHLRRHEARPQQRVQRTALFRNRAVTDAYEPGSVFKLFTTAAALDQGLVTPETGWYDTGEVDFGDWTIRNWDNSANGTQTVQDILTKSLNTGAACISNLCGPDIFYRLRAELRLRRADRQRPLRRGGRHRPHPPDDPDDWTTVDLATNASARGSPRRRCRWSMALAAIANGGTLMQAAVREGDRRPDRTRSTSQPEVVRQVISAPDVPHPSRHDGRCSR